MPVYSSDVRPPERALMRYHYGARACVVTALRAAVVAAAVASRHGRGKNPRSTLTVRLDILVPEL